MYRVYNFIILVFIVENCKYVQTQSNCNGTQPLCVDQNYVLVKSICVNGKWNLAKECKSIQQPFQLECLAGDDLYEDYCIHIRGAHSWSPDTPVYEVDILDWNNLQHIVQNYLQDKKSKITSFWLPAKRLEKYGKVAWTIPKLYHSNFRLQLNGTVPDLVSQDCVLYLNRTFIKLEDCSKKYPTIHIYKPENRYFTFTTPWYYSTSSTNGYFMDKKCRHLAEPKTKEENFIIKRLVEISEFDCKIGVERNENGVFVWTSSKNPINFTDWMPSTDFKNTIVVMTKEGWTLRSSSKDAEHSVCQVDYTKYKVDMNINLNENETLISVTQHSSHKIKSTALRTIGLEDIHLKANFTEFKVYNDYTDIENKFEKLDRRWAWYVNASTPLSNEFYFDYVLLPNIEEKRTTKIFLPRNKILQEYSFEAEIKKICHENICDPNIKYELYKNIAKIITQELTAKTNNIHTVRVMKILNINKDGDLKILLHLHMNNIADKVETNYEIIKNILKRKKIKFENYYISLDDSIKFSSACLPDKTKTNNCEFEWKFTPIGDTYTASNCDNRIATRKCEGNYIDGAKWAKHRELSYTRSEKTKKIEQVLNKLINVSASKAVQELSNVTAVKSDIKPLDLHFISAIFKNIHQSSDKIIDNIAFARSTSLIVNNLLASTITSVEEPDLVASSANDMLQNIEELLPQISANNINENGTNTILEDNFVHVMINPFVRGISGIALINPNNIKNPSFKKYEIHFIHTNMTTENITKKENLEMATYVPFKLLQNVREYSNEKARISINIFYNDTLFIPNNAANATKPLTKIIDVSILHYSRILFSPLPVILKTRTSSCGFWDFGSKIDKNSQWKFENDLVSNYDNDTNIQICYFTHLTNFAMLLGKHISTGNTLVDGNSTDLLNQEDNTNLQIITAVGSVLSTVGICGIFFTACMFKSWRQMIGSKVVLNVCGCILLQIILIYSNVNYTDIACAISGSLLHYSVLCGFSWSLVMAVLHYMKFVKVIGPQTPHLLLKASLVGWVLPIIPVISAVAYNYITIGQYLPNFENLGGNICYPQGIVMYVSLLLPVGLIVYANLVIFFIVFYNVAWRPKIRNTLDEKQMLIQQIKLAVFLFFLLGLTWISGLLAVIFHTRELLYLFTTTATMQGFVLFLFYVIFDQKTRRLWQIKLQSTGLSKKFSILYYSKETESDNISKDELSRNGSTDWTSQNNHTKRKKLKPTENGNTSV